MSIESLKKQAKKDYKKLSKLVSDYKGPPKELCIKLNGFNFNNYEHFFDCNYGVICATVKWSDKGIVLSEHIDIWDNEAVPTIVCSTSINEM